MFHIQALDLALFSQGAGMTAGAPSYTEHQATIRAKHPFSVCLEHVMEWNFSVLHSKGFFCASLWLGPGDTEPSGACSLMWSDVGVQGDTGAHSMMVETDANGLSYTEVRAMVKGERSKGLQGGNRCPRARNQGGFLKEVVFTSTRP